MPATRKRDSTFLPYTEETVVASAARTTTGQSTALTGFGAADRLMLQVNVTAASGTTPTLLLTVEDSLDGTAWRGTTSGSTAVATSASITATGTYWFHVNAGTNFGDRIRLKWTIGGTTPSFTFSVTCASWVD